MAKASRHARRDSASQRPYARMTRVSELCHQIVAEELERLDDERLDLVTVTHVAIDPDLRRGVVDITALGGDDAAAVEVLEEHRARLQRAIASQARLKRTPELHFRPDTVLRRGERIEAVLRDVTVDDGAPGDGVAAEEPRDEADAPSAEGAG